MKRSPRLQVSALMGKQAPRLSEPGCQIASASGSLGRPLCSLSAAVGRLLVFLCEAVGHE